MTVTEAGGNTETQTVAITVNDVNEAPMVTGGLTVVEYAENATTPVSPNPYASSDPDAGTTVTLTLQGADADKFNFAAGSLTFKAAPNYESPDDAGGDNVYNVTVVATDNGVGGNGRNKMTSMRDVTITVTNEMEDGMVTLSSQQPMSGVALMASVTDADGNVTDVTWKWYRSADDVTTVPDIFDSNGDFSADNWTEIDNAVSATYTPTTNGIGAYLLAIATYTDGKGKDSSESASAATVVARTDNAPKFPAIESGERSIPENLAADTPNVGDPVRATDADGGLLTYSLGGADAGSFSIASDTSETDLGGQITVKAGTKLNHEAKSAYMVMVTVTDSDNFSASIDVTITITDENEMPEVTGDARIDYDENGTDPVSTFTATDPEGGAIYWSLLTAPGSVAIDGANLEPADVADNGDFSISDDGVLTFNIPPDFESPDDEGGDNVYNIVLAASDDEPGAGGMVGHRKVTITVEDVIEMGRVTLSSLQPQITDVLTATFTDLDRASAAQPAVADVAWKWEKSQSRTSGWTAISGGTLISITPDATTTGYYLRATATYDDLDGDETTAQAVSANSGTGGAYVRGRQRCLPQ